MKTTNTHFVTDSLAFICFVFLASTGIIMAYLLPPGSGRWLSLWGMGRHQWGEVHFWLAVAFLSLIALHIWFHRRWLIAVVGGKVPADVKRRLRYGLVSLAVLLAFAAAPIVSFYL